MAEGRGFQRLVVGLRHFHRLVERPLHLGLEPALDGGRDEVGGDDEDQDPGREGQGQEGQHQLGLEARADDLVPVLEGELHQVAEQEDEQEEEDDQVEVEQREDNQVGREGDLRRPDADLEDRGDDQQDEDPGDDEQVPLAALLLVGPAGDRGERHHWLLFSVRRFERTQSVSSASPVNRANHELTPPRETTDCART